MAIPCLPGKWLFPGKRGVDDCPTGSLYRPVSEKNLWRQLAQAFLWPACTSCHPINSVKAINELGAYNMNRKKHRKPCIIKYKNYSI